jgi:hypothetical protein
VSSYHRMFSQRRWSAWTLARMLIAFLLNQIVPSGQVLLAGDDTVTEHPGPKIIAHPGQLKQELRGCLPGAFAR